MRLGVNIDHIATLRQARLEVAPDPIAAAKEAIAGGANGIVCHLREDRRHIQDKDVLRLRKLKARLDLEMAATPEMFKFALKLKPHMVTIVPEKRRELTTEGGLDVSSKLKAQNSKLLKQIRNLKKAGIIVSLFVDPQAGQIRASKTAGADFVEIHTGEYCRRPNARELAKVKAATKLALDLGLRVNAGHGLDYNNVKRIARVPGIEELNIGYSIIARSVFVGMKKAVQEMRRAMR